MASGEAFESEWLRWLRATASVEELWQALQADGGSPGAACAQTFRSWQGQIDGTLTTLRTAMQQLDTPEHTPPPPWNAPWLDALARLGPWQDDLQRTRALQQSSQAYLRALAACSEQLLEAVRSGLARLEQRLATAAEHGEGQPGTLRELYELWLEESEAAYEAMLTTETWAEAFGRLTNATSEVIARYQEQADAALSTLDLPTRTDWIDTQRRVARLEATIRRSPAAQEIAALRSEVAELRQEVAALRTTPPDGPES